MSNKSKKQHNLNKKKSTKIILLILSLLFVAVPILTLIINLVMLSNHPFL